eukprot:15387282-Heterocapsa_arctica.AAC.1
MSLFSLIQLCKLAHKRCSIGEVRSLGTSGSSNPYCKPCRTTLGSPDGLPRGNASEKQETRNQ